MWWFFGMGLWCSIMIMRLFGLFRFVNFFIFCLCFFLFRCIYIVVSIIKLKCFEWFFNFERLGKLLLIYLMFVFWWCLYVFLCMLLVGLIVIILCLFWVKWVVLCLELVLIFRMVDGFVGKKFIMGVWMFLNWMFLYLLNNIVVWFL